jgi:hypothetical protein
VNLCVLVESDTEIVVDCSEFLISNLDSASLKAIHFILLDRGIKQLCSVVEESGLDTCAKNINELHLEKPSTFLGLFNGLSRSYSGFDGPVTGESIQGLDGSVAIVVVTFYWFFFMFEKFYFFWRGLTLLLFLLCLSNSRLLPRILLWYIKSLREIVLLLVLQDLLNLRRLTNYSFQSTGLNGDGIFKHNDGTIVDIYPLEIPDGNHIKFVDFLSQLIVGLLSDHCCNI